MTGAEPCGQLRREGSALVYVPARVLTLRLFGDLAVEVDGRPRPVPDRRPGSLLLAWLALHPGLHARGDVAAALWPDVLGDSARASLRSALAAIRRSLGPAHGEYLTAARFAIGLTGPGGVSVDAMEFRALVRAGSFEHALRLCRGPLLQGFDEDWVVRLREEYRARLGEALGEAAAAAQAAGDRDRAVALSRRRVDHEPLSEPVARELIERLGEAGDRPGAMTAYNALAERLHSELGVTPSAETRRLVAAIRQRSGPGSDEPRPQLPLPPLVRAEGPLAGRREELAELRALAAPQPPAGTAASRPSGAVASPRPSLALVAGEAGIGKTRVLAALAAAAHAGGAQVLAGACRPDGEVAYAPVAGALREALAGDPQALAALAALPGAAPLSALLPELAGDAADEQRDGDPARLHAAVRAALRWVGGGRRVLLGVDDLHWADASTLRLLEELADGGPGLDVTVVAAHRPLPDGPVARATRRWRRRASTVAVDLAGLDEPAVAQLVEAVRGRRPPDALVRALHRRTAGHPLFVAELLRHLAPATGWPAAGAVTAAALPDTVAEILGERIDALAGPAQRALAVGAAVGEEFGFELVAAVAGDEEGTLDALDQAVGAALLRELGPGRYAFVHATVREAAYGRLTETRRAHLHRRIAEALDAAPADPASVRRLAEHHLRAAELGDPQRAAHVALLAAEQAIERRAPEEGAMLLERALAALPAEAEPVRRAALLTRLGHARRRAGEGDAVREAFAAAAEAARSAGDSTLLGEAALGLCTVPWFPGTEPEDPVATAALREALAADVAAPLRARLRAQLVRDEYFTAGPGEIRRRAAAVVEEARAVGDDGAVAAALETWSLALAGAAPPAERRTVAQELLALATRAGDAELELRARVWDAVAALQAGDWEAARASEAAVDALGAELRRPAWTWWPALWRAMRALREGDLDEGERLAWAAWEIGERPLGERAALELQTQLFWIRWRQGRLDELSAAAGAMSERYAQTLPAWRCVEALVAAEQGRDAQARTALRELARDGFAALPPDMNRLVGLAVAAHACLAIGDTDMATALVAALEPHAGEWPVSGYGGLVMDRVGDTIAALAGIGTRAA